jgi:imidazolonepropionase
MPRALAILNCSQVVTLGGPARPRVGLEMRELGVVQNGALLAVDGLIRAVGSMKDVEPQIPDDAIAVDAGGRVLAPGFVDAHTHLLFGGNRAEEFEQRATGRTYEQIAAAGGGILSTVRKTRSASEDELLDSGRRRLGWLLRGGTTTIEAKSGYGLTVDSELAILRSYRKLSLEGPVEIVPTLLAPHAVPPEFAGNPHGYVEEVAVPLVRAIREQGLAEFADAFVEEGYFDAATLKPYLDEANRASLPLRLHVDQLREGGGAALASGWGAKTADHLEQMGPQGIAALRRSGVTPVLLPGSVFALGKSRYPDARQMIDKGLAVVLATDFNPGSSPVCSMAFVMSLACTQMRLTPAEALCAATVNAAYSLNRGHDRGTLEPGKRADMALHDVEDWREIPYWIGREGAWKVFAGGKEVELRR